MSLLDSLLNRFNKAQAHHNEVSTSRAAKDAEDRYYLQRAYDLGATIIQFGELLKQIPADSKGRYFSGSFSPFYDNSLNATFLFMSEREVKGLNKFSMSGEEINPLIEIQINVKEGHAAHSKDRVAFEQPTKGIIFPKTSGIIHTRYDIENTKSANDVLNSFVEWAGRVAPHMLVAIAEKVAELESSPTQAIPQLVPSP